MKRDFVLDKEDYVDFNIFVYDTSPAAKRKRTIQMIVFPIIYLLIPVFLNIYKSVPYIQTFPIFIIASIVWVIAYPKISKFGVKKNVRRVVDFNEKKGNKMTGDYSVEITDKGITVDNGQGSVEMLWENISEIKEDEKRIYIFLNSMTAYIIKKDAFADQKEEEEFKNTIITNVEKSKTE